VITPDRDLATFLEDLHTQGREHDAGQEDRLERWRNLEPETAQLLALLVRALAPRKVLELGTSNGYSTIWLAHAVRGIGGSLLSVEIDAARAEHARANLRAAGLEDAAELRVDDAAAVLGASEDGEWGLVFLDAERPAYPSYWPDLVRVLPERGLLVVDNAISHADEMTDFRELVERDARVSEALVPTGAGALLVLRESS
jgi:predicted O-methyltransferase YrrM